MSLSRAVGSGLQRRGVPIVLIMVMLLWPFPVRGLGLSPGRVIVVTSLLDSGPGSFRQALLDALPGDTITFSTSVFPPTAPATILVLDQLPALGRGNVTIDAANAGVVLDGRYAPPGTHGLVINSNGNTVKGLQIVRFPDDGISLCGSAAGNVIGGDATVGAGPSGEGNIITQNGNVGLDICGSARNNTITGNRIGVDADFTRDFRSRAVALSPAYTADRTVFVGTPYDGLWRSTDAGATWAQVAAELPNILSLAVSPAYVMDGTLFAGTATDGVWRSTDRGATWARVDGGAIVRSAVSIALSPGFAADRHVYVATDGQAVYRSHDGGATWAESDEGIAEYLIHGVAVSPGYTSDHTVFAVSWNAVSLSTDGGATWRAPARDFAQGLTRIAVSPAFARDRTVYALRQACNEPNPLWRSTDGGVTWAAVATEAPWCTPRSLILAPDFETSRTLFVGDDWGGVYKSVDAGRTWSKVHSDRFVVSLAASPDYAADRIVFAGTVRGGILRTTDRGASWQDVAAGLSEPGNQGAGILLRENAGANTIGGLTAGRGNVIGRNGSEGIGMIEPGVQDNAVLGNFIGVTPAGDPIGNASDGIIIRGGAARNRVGGAAPGEGNVISANGMQGIALSQADTGPTWVTGNRIGVLPHANRPLGNGMSGVLMWGPTHDNELRGNIIGGSGENGITIHGGGFDNVIAGNFIGVAPDGADIGNHLQGVQVSDGSRGNRIGGATANDRNVVGHNGANGVTVWEAGTRDNVVAGNYIGVAPDGATAAANGEFGLILSGGATGNRAGGSLAEANVISGNGADGVLITEEGTSDNEVTGNIIGLAADGRTRLGNRHGLACWGGAAANRITGNVIAGNRFGGMELDDCHRFVIAGNWIGTDRGGALQLGNLEDGISLFGGSSENVIGPANVIAYNQFSGIGQWSVGTRRNTLTGNSIYGNGEGAIYIDDEIGLSLSPPVITGAEPFRVAGLAPVAGARIEVFSDEGGQARVYEGAATAGPNGAWQLDRTQGFAAAYLTATATDAGGSTTELSQPFTRPQSGAGDAFEPDGGCSTARAILTDGTQQARTFAPAGDVDWVRFDALKDREYLIEAGASAGSLADVRLEVHGNCGGALLTGQGYVFSPDVRLRFRAPASGPIYLALRHAAAAGGEQFAYRLSVVAGDQAALGAAIIVAGRLKQGDDLQPNIHEVTDSAYRLFKGRGYPADRLHYLATDLTRDADQDRVRDVAALPTADALRRAIVEWAPDRVGLDRALTIFLIDHGDAELFFLDKVNGQYVTPEQLDQWLSELEAARPGVRINLVIEACYAGSFISLPRTLSRNGRVVVASTASVALAAASSTGAAFSDAFIMSLGQGETLLGSFQAAAWAVAPRGQTPWLDANGNGLHNEAEDEAEAARRGFNVAGTFPSDTERWPPYIVQAFPPASLAAGRGVLVAEVRDDLGVDEVWASVRAPEYVAPAGGSSWVPDDAPRVRLMPQGGNRFAGEFAGFTRPGAYEVIVQARDSQGQAARPVRLTVEVRRSLYLPLLVR